MELRKVPDGQAFLSPDASELTAKFRRESIADRTDDVSTPPLNSSASPCLDGLALHNGAKDRLSDPSPMLNHRTRVED